MQPSSVDSAPFSFLPAGGVAGRLVRSVDWASTPLGPPDTWSLTLKSTLAMVLSSRHPMFIWWGPELVQFYNDAYLPSFGDPEGPDAKHPRAMGQRGVACWPEIWPLIAPQIDDVMKRGIPSWNEDQLVPIHRNGRLEDVYWTYGYSPLFELDGTVGGTLVVCQETTNAVLQKRALEGAHREAQAAIEESRQLAESIPQQVWSATADGALDFVNERVTAYFETSREAILGAGWLGVLHPDDAERVVASWTQSLATGAPYEVEFRLRRADGSYRWHLGRAMPLHDLRGEVYKWFGTNTDIHEFKSIREELARRTEFEQHLVGIVSHDLRNPLNAILLGAQTLAMLDELGPRSAKVALRMQAAAERGARMIRDLLDFTQARLGGGLPITRSTLDLHVVASAVLEEVRAAHPERELAIDHEGDGSGEWDGDRVAQAIANLVSNAIHHGDPQSAIRVRSRGDDGHVMIEVHNHGPAIPPTAHATLFEPLKRGAGQLTGTRRSIGLGLYIVNEIATRHDGAIAVHSSVADGTTFTLRLPRRARPPA